MKGIFKVLLVSLIFLLPCNCLAADEYTEQYEIRTCTLNVTMAYGGYIEIENYTDLYTYDYIRLPGEADMVEPGNTLSTSVTVGYMYDKVNEYGHEPNIMVQPYNGYGQGFWETDFNLDAPFGTYDTYNVNVVFEEQMTPWLFVDEEFDWENVSYEIKDAYMNVEGDLPDFETGTLVLGNNSYEGGTIKYEVDLDESGMVSEDLRETVEHKGQYYNLVYAASWDEYRDEIKNIIIWDGILWIDPVSFDNFSALDFRKYKNLESITIPPTMSGEVSLFGMERYGAYPSLKNITVASSNGLYDNDSGSYTSVDGVLYDSIKTKIIKYPPCKEESSFILPETVETIEDYAFMDCGKLKSIVLPDNLMYMNQCAFSYSGLEKVTIPENVKYLNWGAFKGCSGLKEFTMLSENVTEIEWEMFSGCVSLTDINLPTSVTYIGSTAFAGCTSLKTFSIPDHIKSIGDSAFSGCTGLEAVYLPEGLSTLPDRIFGDCANLSYVYMSESITRIEDYAFVNCEKLPQISIPTETTYIGKYAFSGCANLINLKIPAKVEFLSPTAFNGCKRLGNFTIDDNNPYYCLENGIIFSKDKTKLIRCLENVLFSEYTIPHEVTMIGEYAFRGCSNIQELKLSPSLTTIQTLAFAGCSQLKEIIIPATLNWVQYGAFDGCEKLDTIYYGGSLSEWMDITIASYNNNLIYATKIYNSKVTYSSYVNKNGIILVSILNTDITENNPNNIIVAGYSSNGAFLRVGQEMQSEEESYLTYLIDAENIGEVKVFVWEDIIKPVTIVEKLTIE